ncbi:MAG: hypothetical protein JSS79_02525 [Bacteroidetes bacterium]|nr:hypothetical protein [Bacteroidota bacterium]
MTFQELQYHIESLGCNIDPLGDELYMASNCINGQVCMIEQLDEYAIPTLCHYFYELGVSAPEHLRDHFDRYAEFREQTIGNILPEENQAEE